MNNKSEILMNNKSIVLDTVSWLFGIAVIAVGLINIFWGNDAGFGAFLILLSFVYFTPLNTLLKEKIGFSIPLLVKIILGIFIIIASLGVGELFHKIDLMLMDI